MPRDQIDEGEVTSYRSIEGRPLSAQELMATPDHMLAWLRSKPADEVVAADLWDTTCCLGATFLHESGHPGAEVISEAGWTRDGRPIRVCRPIVEAIVSLALFKKLTTATAADALATLTHTASRRRSEIGA